MWQLVEELPDSIAVDAVIVTKQVSRLETEGSGCPKLLNDPFHGGMACRRDMNHFPASVVKNDKHVEQRSWVLLQASVVEPRSVCQTRN